MRYAWTGLTGVCALVFGREPGQPHAPASADNAALAAEWAAAPAAPAQHTTSGGKISTTPPLSPRPVAHRAAPFIAVMRQRPRSNPARTQLQVQAPLQPQAAPPQLRSAPTEKPTEPTRRRTHLHRPLGGCVSTQRANVPVAVCLRFRPPSESLSINVCARTASLSTSVCLPAAVTPNGAHTSLADDEEESEDEFDGG